MKQRIRLTESDLHRIVKESVKRILRESEYSDLSQDEFDYLYRMANDRRTPSEHHHDLYYIYRSDANGNRIGERLACEFSFNSTEEAIDAAEKKVAEYDNGLYLLEFEDFGILVYVDNGKVKEIMNV